MEVSLEVRRLRFRRPLSAAYGSLLERELLELELRQDGLRGRGEAAPLEVYDGVGLPEVHAALRGYREILERAGASGRAEVLEACRVIADLPQALAAVDVALWDLEAQRAGRPLAALLSPSPASEIAMSAAVDAVEPGLASDDASLAAGRGFRCVKLKVGAGDDVARALAVRGAVGPEVALRLDANGAWSGEEAVGKLQALAAAEPELIEEPVHGLVALRELRSQTQLPLAIDETAADPESLRAGVADAVCLKLSRCGGVSGLLDDAAAARASGSRVYLGSTYDGPVGIAAALHAAAAIGPDHPCGLATLELFEPGDLTTIDQNLAVRAGRLAVPVRPGLGL